MTKKKKEQNRSVDQNNINDIVENKDIISQYNEDTKDNNIPATDESRGTEDLSDSIDPGSGKEASPAKEVEKGKSLEEKLAEMQDRYLRLSAEFDNYRKRTLREKMELTKHAGENILNNIIPVMDDFERALKLMENAPDIVAMKSGIDLIYNKFSEFLKQNGITEIESLNKEFNVDLHDAITKVPVQDESMKGKVVDVIAKGYWLHDKVMRHSKVVVGE